METLPSRKCQITTYYLSLIGAELHDDENGLLYDNLEGEYQRACELAKSAGTSPELQTLRAFVLVEVIAAVLWRHACMYDSRLVESRYRIADYPRIKLRTRSYESLTDYIKWAKEMLDEYKVDHIHYENFSVATDREIKAHRSKVAAEVLTLGSESASILRASLRNVALSPIGTPPYIGITQRFHRTLLLCGDDPHSMLKHARNLLSITEQDAPRGWELP
jgi:hypothetical protein